MYELKRQPKISEQLRLGEEVINIDIDIEASSIDFNKRRNEVILAEQEIKKMRESGVESEEVLKKYGEAITNLMVVVFGVDNTEKIVNFYENRYMELTLEVFPFIIEVIGPKMKAGIEQMRQKAGALYKSSQAAKLGMNRETRRRFGK